MEEKGKKGNGEKEGRNEWGSNDSEGRERREERKRRKWRGSVM